MKKSSTLPLRVGTLYLILLNLRKMDRYGGVFIQIILKECKSRWTRAELLWLQDQMGCETIKNTIFEILV